MSSACRYVRTAGFKNTRYFPEEARAFLDHIPVSPADREMIAHGNAERLLPPSEEHTVEVLFEDPLVVVAAPNNPLARRRQIELAELLEEPWTLQPRENSFGAFAMDAFRAAGVSPPRILVATTSSNLRGEMLATGRYLSMVPRYWVLLPSRNPSPRVLPLEFPHTRLKVAIVTLKNRSLNRATELFLDRVRALVRPLAREK